MISVVPALKARILAIDFISKNPRLTALLDHPAGPFTSKCVCVCLAILVLSIKSIENHQTHDYLMYVYSPAWHVFFKMDNDTHTVHFWAPTMKWGISIANIADYNRPPELISYPQQIGK